MRDLGAPKTPRQELPCTHQSVSNGRPQNVLWPLTRTAHTQGPGVGGGPLFLIYIFYSFLLE